MLKKIITADNSPTLYVPELDEHYHSVNGALTESEHIFIQNGLLQKAKEQSAISIFEMGFGTGLNALLTKLVSEEKKLEIEYFTIEAFPIEKTLFEKLNFSERLELKGEKAEYLKALHKTDWERKTELFSNFQFEKRNIKLEAVELPENTFDLVYFDAFNPDLQPELWTEDVFRKIYLAMKSKGILMTYSAKGKVKRALKAAGFVLNALPGPIGKREITQAIKI